jgi:hypothetical protein
VTASFTPIQTKVAKKQQNKNRYEEDDVPKGRRRRNTG